MSSPTFRPDLDTIPRYVPGKPIEEVAREFGLTSIDKLASNENPTAPFPAVREAIADAAHLVNRYPDSASYDLTNQLAEFHDLAPESIWVGAGSSEVLRCTALTVGGPGTSAVYANPSFIMYVIGTRLSGAETVPVPLTDALDHDLDAMLGALRDDTTIVYVCNPNNPTGGIRSGDDVRRFIDEVPERISIVVDEAYAEYVTDDRYESLLEEAPLRSNVLVARTFSKIYGLAGLRIGFGVGNPALIDKLRTTQAPFSVSAVSQAAASEALRYQDEVEQRRKDNAIGRITMTEGLTDLGYRVAPSQANFVYFETPDAERITDGLLHVGVVVRRFGDAIRVTVGTADENSRFLMEIAQFGAVDA